MIGLTESLRSALADYYQELPDAELVKGDVPDIIARATSNLTFLNQHLPERVPALPGYLTDSGLVITFNPGRNDYGTLYPTNDFFMEYRGDTNLYLVHGPSGVENKLRADSLPELLRDPFLGAIRGFSSYLKRELVGKVISTI